MQYCRWKPGTEIERIISVDAIENWKDDSLYIYGDDDNKFISHYGNIFTGGVYNNGKSGVVDIYGINYYSQELTELILEQVKGMKLFNDPILLGWLETAKKYNGFYILGL